MREIPSEMEFHGFLGSLENSDRSAHDRGAMGDYWEIHFIPALYANCLPVIDEGLYLPCKEKLREGFFGPSRIVTYSSL